MLNKHRDKTDGGPTGGTAATCKCGHRGSSPTLCPPPVHLISHSSQGTPWKVWPKKFHVQNSVPPNLTATCGRRMPWCCNSACHGFAEEAEEIPAPKMSDIAAGRIANTGQQLAKTAMEYCCFIKRFHLFSLNSAANFSPAFWGSGFWFHRGDREIRR